MVEVLPPRKKYIKSKLVEKNPAPKGKARHRPTEAKDKGMVKVAGGQAKKDKIIEEFKLGCFTLAQLAHRHDISDRTVWVYVQGIAKDYKHVYDTGMDYYRELAKLKPETSEVLKEFVELQNSQLKFISCVTIKNIAHVSAKIDHNTTLPEHMMIQQILKTGRETVEPPRINQAVTVNQTTGINIKTLSDEELIQESRRIDEKLRIVGDGK